MSNEHVESGREELKKTMSPAEVWALAVGAIIGWGCFVLPGARFLPEAGPIGSVLAFIVGGGLLCFVALAYSILVKAYPVAGGAFTYAYVGFGKAWAFICGWALILGYLCVIAANGTALALLSRALLPGVFDVGYLYSVAGWDVYAGELAMMTCAFLFFGYMNFRGMDFASSIQLILAFALVAGVLILTVQHEQLREAALHSELAAMDEVLHRQYEQYKRSKEGIRLINSRCHELKIQIADIRAERDRAKQDAALARMERGIRQYEAENKTGNPVLDTLLTAKSMDCQQRGINMTSVADGSQLGFLSTRELCTLVGAPLDNAIESVLAEPDPEKRLLRVAIYNQSGCVMLRFENYCAQPVEMGADGLPVHNAHGGYDLQGVQAAAQRHDGTMTLHWADGWFTLRILLPVPEK